MVRKSKKNQNPQVTFSQPDPGYNPNYQSQGYPQQAQPQPTVNNYPNTGYQTNQVYTTQPASQPYYNNYTQTNPNQTINNPGTMFTGPQPSQQIKKPFSFKEFLKKRWWLVILVGILIIGVITIGLIAFLSSQNQGESQQVVVYDNVRVAINAPSTLPKGTPGDWEIQLENKESASLTNIQLQLKFDQDFQYLQEYNPRPDNLEGTLYSIPRLDPVSGRAPNSTVRFQGLLNGNVDVETRMGGVISYVPELPDGTRLEVVEIELKEAITRITSPKINISINPSANEIQNGGEVEFVVLIENTTDQEIRDLRLRMIYPGNEKSFIYKSSKYFRSANAAPINQPSNGDDIWDISRLPAGTRQTLSVIGNVFGSDKSSQTFGVEIGIKNNQNDYQTIWQGYKDVVIIAQPLLITTEILGKDSFNLVEPGETINIEVSYQNQSQRTLSNVEIFSFIEDRAKILDLSTIRFSGGERGDVTGSELVWKAPRIPGLATLTPNQSGSFKYSVKILDEENFVKTSLDQQQYVLIPGVRAKADSLDQIVNTGATYRGRGKLVFDSPKPEVVGINPSTNRKIYKFTWRITSRQNEVTETQVRAITPVVGAWRPESVEPASSRSSLTYNEQTGQIIWDIGNVRSYTGITTKTLEVTFELEIGEGENIILENPTATGLDVFTGEKYEIKLGNVRG